MRRAPRTDYETIAASYDEDRKHWEIPPDDIVASGAVHDVLDVGCGTGLWLSAQRGHFPDAKVRWGGLDASAAMLGKAKAKAGNVLFVHAIAEAIPFASSAIDYVYSSFAYHHFADKEAAFDEVGRVLRSGGTFRIRHIDPENMEGWWVYRFFPKTRELDELRFWTTAALRDALHRRGFDVDYGVEPEIRHSPAHEIVEEAERRVVSQLAILDDDAYRVGLDELRSVDEPIETHWAGLTLTAKKRV